jgi:hypothetical protein
MIWVDRQERHSPSGSARRVFASDTRWTVVRGSKLEEGDGRGLLGWNWHVGDPTLDSNITRRAAADGQIIFT